MKPLCFSAKEELIHGVNSEMVFDFFVVFSRFEYALKRAGFLKNGTRADPDWTAFADKVAKKFEKLSNSDLIQAKAYLINNPPKKQIREGKRFDWIAPQRGTTPEARWLLVLVKIVRNNLFHGGKYPRNIQSDPARDSQLIESCLIILCECIHLDEEVERFFLEAT